MIKKRLKIAILVSSFPTTSETFIVNQITDLIDKGHTVTIFAFQQNKNKVIHQKILDYKLLEKTVFFKDTSSSMVLRYFAFLNFIFSNRKKIDFFKLIRIFNYKIYGRKALNLRNYTKFKWILKYGNIQIIHAHFGPNGVYIAEMKKFGFLTSTKLITSFHGYDLSPHLLTYYKNKYQDLFEEADLLTVNTKYTKSLLKKITSENNIKILPVGLDTNKFKRNESEINSDFLLIFIGRLIPLKAPDLAVEVVRRLVIKGYCVRLDIIGEGEMYRDLEEFISKNNLEENVKLKGALAQEEVIKLMTDATIFILPGIYDSNGRAETQGLVIQEAQSMGLPVIISDVGGMKYGIEDCETGFVVKEKDVDGFVDKVEFLLNNEEKRKEMGKKGRNFVTMKYDSKHLGDKLELYYNQVIER